MNAAAIAAAISANPALLAIFTAAVAQPLATAPDAPSAPVTVNPDAPSAPVSTEFVPAPFVEETDLSTLDHSALVAVIDDLRERLHVVERHAAEILTTRLDALEARVIGR